MTGSLQIKNGKYYAVINTYQNGKRKQKWIDLMLSEKGNKKKAEKALREQLRVFESKEHLIYTDTLFCDYINYWLTRIKVKIDPITFESYQEIIKGHIYPYFQDKEIKLGEITADIFQEYIDNKYSKGRKDHKGGLSANTLSKHKNIVNQVTKLAVKEGYLLTNICQIVDLPRKEKHEARFYTKEQADILLSVIKDEPIYPLILIAIVYGMRRSEICGLQWDSIDFFHNTLTVKHTLVKHTTLVAKDTTKTQSSYRTYPLIEKVKDIILQLKKDQEENRMLLGKEYYQNQYIFTWADGRPITPDYLSHKFAKIIKKYNLPKVSIHELRHSCASILLSNGFTLKDVQEWLGHADISMTANIYGHLDMNRKQSLADNMISMLSEARM